MSNLINYVAFLDYEQAVDRFPDFLKDPREYNCKKNDKSFISFFREYSKELIERFQDFLVEQESEDFKYNIINYNKSNPLVYRFKTTENGLKILEDINYKLSEMRFEIDLRDDTFEARVNT